MVGEARIAKTLSFAVGDCVALVVRAGDARVTNPKGMAACGSSNSAIGPTPAEPAELALGSVWVGVCRVVEE